MTADRAPIPRRARRDARPRGSVLVAFIVVLAILQVAVFGIVLASARGHDLTARRAEAARSFYAADAALAMAVREVHLNSDIDGDGVVGGVTGFTLGAAGAGVTAAAAGDEFTLTSTAAAGEAGRRLQAVIRRGGSSEARGLKVEIWLPGTSLSSLSQVPWSTTPAYTGVVPNINFPNQSTSTRRFAGMPSSRIGMRFTGQIRIPSTGAWTFSLGSDDGADLRIGGVRVINHDGLHSYSTRSGAATLSEGTHDLEVRFFENTGNNGLVLSWQGPGVPVTTVVPPAAFTTDATMPPLAAHTTMYLHGDNSQNATTVDGYDSAAGAYGLANVSTTGAVAALNSTAAGAWQMSGRATLQGSALVGPGGSPASVISLSGSSSITGTRTAAASRAAIFLMPPTLGIASSGALALSGSTAQTVSTDRRWSSVSLSNSSVLTLAGTITIRIDGDLSVIDNARIALSSDADVSLYVSGDVTVSNDGAINAATADAGRLRTFMGGTGKSLRISNRGRVSAYVLNPLGGLSITPTGNAPNSFAGRFAGDWVQTSDKTDIHLDLSTGGSGGAGGTSPPTVTSWSAVQP